MRHGLPLTAPSGGANLPYKCPCKGDPGKVPTEPKAALDAAGLKAFQGDDASVQSGELGDCMLHEAAVSLLRLLEGQTTPAVP